MQKTMKLTDEQKAMLPVWRDRWIEIGLSTQEMTEKERAKTRTAVVELYKAAKLEPIPEKRVVFVQSPLIGQIVAGIAASAWHLTSNSSSEMDYAVSSAVNLKVEAEVYSEVESEVDSKVYSAVRSEVESAVRSAVYSEVDSAVYSEVYSAVGSEVDSKVYSAVQSAVRSEVRSEVESAVYSAVGPAVDSEVESAVYSAVGSEVESAVGSAVGSAVRSEVESAVEAEVDAAVRSAVYSEVEAEVYSAVRSAMEVDSAVDSAKHQFIKSCCLNAWKLRHGGNLWVAFPSFISYFDRVLNLPINFDNFHLLEILAQSSGIRYMHKKFCIISDRPCILKRDDRGRLHNAEGPAIAWRDGFSLYFWHGIRVSQKAIERPESIHKEEILAEKNQEVRRAMCEIVGWEKTISMLGAIIIHKDTCLGLPRELLHIELPNEVIHLVSCRNGTIEPDGTRRRFLIGIPAEIKTCHEAIAWTYGFSPKAYKEALRA